MVVLPHQDEAKDINFSRRRGRNRKTHSELPDLLSLISLSSDVAVTSRDHLWILRNKTKKMGQVRHREVAGIGKRHRRCPTFFCPFLSLPATT